nr:uncharacterized protein CI109_007105 [Kwoniella shandongensis]KAA5524558.1 hypothetical protein CI109_007105 [Kwoniella shandongensis]
MPPSSQRQNASKAVSSLINDKTCSFDSKVPITTIAGLHIAGDNAFMRAIIDRSASASVPNIELVSEADYEKLDSAFQSYYRNTIYPGGDCRIPTSHAPVYGVDAKITITSVTPTTDSATIDATLVGTTCGQDERTRHEFTRMILRFHLSRCEESRDTMTAEAVSEDNLKESIAAAAAQAKITAWLDKVEPE